MTEDDFIDGGDDPVQAHAKQVARAIVQEDQELRTRKVAYARLFAGTGTADDAAIVLDDLLRFGRVFESTVVPAGAPEVWPRDVLEGRRQVALRVMEFSGLPIDALFQRYHRPR